MNRIGKKRDFFENDEEYNDYLMDFEDIGLWFFYKVLYFLNKVLQKLENRSTEEAEKKLEFYKEKFRKKEESGRIIVSNIKKVNWNFFKKNITWHFNRNRHVGIDSESLYMISGYDKKYRMMKGLQDTLFFK